MQHVLELKNVCKRFGGVVTAENVCLALDAGEVHGLIGPNGAGKTTLINLISGITEHDSGEIYYMGQNISSVPAFRRGRLGIGRTFQVPRFLDRSSVRDNLMLGLDLRNGVGDAKSFFGKPKVNLEAELKPLMEVAGFDLDLDADISGMPFGQLKLLEIVRALLSNPKVLLVDEPAAGLNSKEIDRVSDLLNLAAKEKGIAMLLIEHRMDLVVDICKELHVLVFGKIIAEGIPEVVTALPEVIEAYLGRNDDDQD